VTVFSGTLLRSLAALHASADRYVAAAGDRPTQQSDDPPRPIAAERKCSEGLDVDHARPAIPDRSRGGAMKQVIV
jgi:hypothetical protein